MQFRINQRPSLSNFRLNENFPCQRILVLKKWVILLGLYSLNKAFKALYGHRGFLGRRGKVMTLTWSLGWMVLDHFIKTLTILFSKNISPPAKCLEKSKAVNECGAKFESLKNPKKATRKTALKTGPIYNRSQ